MDKDWQLVIDYDKCSGCRTCELECAKRHYGVINPGARQHHHLQGVPWHGHRHVLPQLQHPPVH